MMSLELDEAALSVVPSRKNEHDGSRFLMLWDTGDRECVATRGCGRARPGSLRCAVHRYASGCGYISFHALSATDEMARHLDEQNVPWLVTDLSTMDEISKGHIPYGRILSPQLQA